MRLVFFKSGDLNQPAMQVAAIYVELVEILTKEHNETVRGELGRVYWRSAGFGFGFAPVSRNKVLLFISF